MRFGLTLHSHNLWVWPVEPSSILNSHLLGGSSSAGRVWGRVWHSWLLRNSEVTMQQEVPELSLTQLQQKLCVFEHTRRRVRWWAATKSQPRQDQRLQQPRGKTLSHSLSLSQLPYSERWGTPGKINIKNQIILTFILRFYYSLFNILPSVYRNF